MALISIILPTYNGEKYLAKAVESCLAQTHRELELIIINDCSTDGTLAIAERFAAADARVQVYSNDQNRKLPASLNIGFSKAKGSLLTWMSDDNYFAPGALQALANVLEEEPETDIAYSSYRFIDEKDRVLESYGGVPENLLFTCIMGALFLYRRKVHEELNGYAEDKFRMEDMDFWLRAAARFRFRFIDGQDLYYYRKHGGSLTFEIYGNEEIYKEYRKNYRHSFGLFFNRGLHAGFSEADLQIHTEIFFEDLLREKNWDFDLSEKLLAYLEHLDRLERLPWEKIHFHRDRVRTILLEKKKRVIGRVVNDLVFDNRVLAGKNPSLAAHINKPLSWYYREYEVLPSWYKRLGHIIKILQGNRPLRSSLHNTLTK